jgi:hypothetical protein
MTPARTRAVGGVGQATPTRILPADDHELDLAVNRVFDSASPGSSRSGRRMASWMTVTVLLLAGLGAAAWARGGLTTARRLAAPARYAGAKPAPVGRAGGKQATVVAQGRPKDARRRSLTLSVTSTPRATVFIDGAKVGETPVAGRTLSVGRAYQIRVERKGYRTKRETITASGTRALRRNYVLEREKRR